MNTKNNRRHQDTLAKIQDVFLELLKDKELNKIKVAEICKEAGINRSTFYANYLDIYDLADKIHGCLAQEVSGLLEQAIDWQDSGGDFLRLFCHIKENQQLYRFYFKLGYDDWNGLILPDIYRHDYGFDVAFLEYHIVFFKQGFNAIVKKWLEDGCRESPQQMRDILLWEYRGRVPNMGVES